MNLVIKSDDILRAWDNVVMLKKRFNQVTSVLSLILSVYRFFLWHFDPIGPRLWLAVAAWLRIFVVYIFRTMISHDHSHDTTRKEKNMRARLQWSRTSRKRWRAIVRSVKQEEKWTNTWKTLVEHTDKTQKKENVKRKRWRGNLDFGKKGGEKSMKLRKCEEKKFKSSCGYKGTSVFAKENWLVNIRITVIIDRAQKSKKNKLPADAEVCQRGTIFTNAHQKAIMRLESLFGVWLKCSVGTFISLECMLIQDENRISRKSILTG